MAPAPSISPHQPLNLTLSPDAATQNWQLPEIMVTIFERLSGRTLVHCQRVCRGWHTILTEQKFVIRIEAVEQVVWVKGILRSKVAAVPMLYFILLLKVAHAERATEENPEATHQELKEILKNHVQQIGSPHLLTKLLELCSIWSVEDRDEIENRAVALSQNWPSQPGYEPNDAFSESLYFAKYLAKLRPELGKALFTQVEQKFNPNGIWHFLFLREQLMVDPEAAKSAIERTKRDCHSLDPEQLCILLILIASLEKF